MRPDQLQLGDIIEAGEDPGTTAARCFHLANQLGGGPVRDALLAMGRDYSTRARAAARTVAVRPAVARLAPPPNRFAGIVDAIIDWLAPMSPPAAPARRVPVAMTVRAEPAAVPRQATPARPSAQRKRGSRLFRTHALSTFS